MTYIKHVIKILIQQTIKNFVKKITKIGSMYK